MSQTEKLIGYIAKLGAVEFAGLAHLLGVEQMVEVNPDAPIERERYEPREFTDVLEDVLKAFEGCNRVRRREILDIVKKASKHPMRKEQVGTYGAAGPSEQTGASAGTSQSDPARNCT